MEARALIRDIPMSPRKMRAVANIVRGARVEQAPVEVALGRGGRHDERPDERRFIGPQASLEDLLAELNLIRGLLTSGGELSDIQLFSQLKNLNEIKAALAAIDNETARRMIREVDQLLESVFASSKFGM